MGKPLKTWFWTHEKKRKNIVICFKGETPLNKVLLLVDSDEKLSMRLIYEAMDQAKEEIQNNFNGVRKKVSLFYLILLKYLCMFLILNVKNNSNYYNF